MDPIKVSFYVFFPGGGIGRYTHELATALNLRPGIEAEISCTPDFLWQEHTDYALWPGLRSIAHPNSLRRRARFMSGQVINPLRFVAHAQETGADVIHFSNVNHLTYPLWRAAVNRARIPVAVSVHDVQRQKGILNRTWEDAQLKAVYRDADILFVHSHYQARELEQWAGVDPDRIHVVPHGPYTHGEPRASREEIRQQLNLPHERQVVLFFGQIRDEKNLDGFLRAMKQADSGIHLLVAGQAGGRHRNGGYYRSLAQELGVDSHVTFIDRYIEDDEVADYFTACDWVALPYHESFTSQSGVLNVAAHYDRPVLVSNSPVLKETVINGSIGTVCDGCGPDVLADGIRLIVGQVEAGDYNGFADYRGRHSWGTNACLSEVSYRDAITKLQMTAEE